jgi:UDP-N-acetylglucosamine 2-epimerase (non-hydrolysing)
VLNKLAEKRKIIGPIHPRTKTVIGKLNLTLVLTDSIGNINFLALMKNAELVITDSGGIQEETTYQRKNIYDRNAYS